MIFYQELDVFGAIPVPGRDSLLYFQVFSWHFYFMRGYSLVELTEHGNSAADIVVHSMHIYVLLNSYW